jgi:hypothetical protein
MRYLFAVVIAAFFVSVDFESSGHSTWMEPSLAAAEAPQEASPVNPDSQNGNINASEIKPAVQSATASVEPAQDKKASEAGAANAAASIDDESALPDRICEAVKDAADEHDIPIGFFVRLLWQESRFRPKVVSSAGAQGIAQFMPRTAVEMGLSNPFDPLQAIPASAKFLDQLRDQFGNLGLAAAAYNAGGGRIQKWLSRRGSLPKETRSYVKIITGHKAEAWTAVDDTVLMPVDLPEKAPCEGVGGLSKDDQIAEVPANLAPSVSAVLRKTEADDAEVKKSKNLRVAARRTSPTSRSRVASRKVKERARLAAKAPTRKLGKQPVVRVASDSAGRTKSSRAEREL